MTEDFLHFVWEFQYFKADNLQTSEGEQIVLLDIGKNNTNAGADYFYAKVLIDEKEWAGTVEIHLKTSDWLNHKHHQNPDYNNVILHVVWEDDKPVLRPDQTPIPTLELKNRVNPSLQYNYKALIENKDTIPCQKQFDQAKPIHKMMMLDKALSKRLERKAQEVQALLQNHQNDWEEITYQLLAKNFGFKINNEPFLQLSQALPLKYLRKHGDSLFQIEALIFGQAGFLDKADAADAYFLDLKKEYTFLAHKYQLTQAKMDVHQWKFLRLRPANFPTVRLAQLSSLIFMQPNLFSLFVESDLKTLKQKLNVMSSMYWQSHFHFNKIAKKTLPSLGKTSIQNLIINTAVPLLACFAIQKSTQEPMDKAIDFLENIPCEKNHITELWESLGLKVKTAFDSQALIELYNHFCMPKKCLNCTIGMGLVKH